MSHVRHTGRAVEPAVIEERPILVQRPCANSRLSRSQVAEPHRGDVATKREHKRSFAELSPITQGLGEDLEIQVAPPIVLSQNGVGR